MLALVPKEAGGKRTLTCPACREPTRVPKGGAAKLSKNFALIG